MYMQIVKRKTYDRKMKILYTQYSVYYKPQLHHHYLHQVVYLSVDHGLRLYYHSIHGSWKK